MTHPGPESSWPATAAAPRDQRGLSVSAFVASVITALLLMGGLVIDGGARIAADRECQLVASEAGRAASDAGSRARAAGLEPDSAAMLAAAQEVIAAHPGVTGVPTISGGVITVGTRKTVSTTFLSLIGVLSLDAAGHAQVMLEATR